VARSFQAAATRSDEAARVRQLGLRDALVELIEYRAMEANPPLIYVGTGAPTPLDQMTLAMVPTDADQPGE
jgi:hypothetical protein